MGRIFNIKVNNTDYSLEEGSLYSITVINRVQKFLGYILKDMDFKYDGKTFFYILDKQTNEEYQINEDELLSIEKL